MKNEFVPIMSVISNDATAITKILPAVTTKLPAKTTTTTTTNTSFHMENNVAIISNNFDAAAPSSDALISHNGREARNLAEKQRRDKLNASIHELSTMVPHVAESTRRLDKTAVLRFAAHGFRLQHVFGKSASQRKRQKHEQPQIADMLLELLDSFLITLTCHGQIVLISETVENLLGHCRLDLYGQNILNIIHPEDQAFLQQQLIPHDLEIMFNRKYPHTTITTTSNKIPKGTTTTTNKKTKSTNEYLQESGDDDDDNDDEEMLSETDDDNYRDQDEDMNCMSEDDDDNADNLSTDKWAFKRSKARRQKFKYLDKRLSKDRRSFTVRVARASTRSETTRNYEIVKFDGCFRRSDNSASDHGNTFPIVAQLIRRQRSTANIGNSVNFMQHDAIAQAALHGVSGNDIVFVGMARIIHPPKLNIYPLHSNNLEYRTRHLIDGRIVDCDQRIGLVAGYMKDEVKNLSPFSFMHQDDVRWVIVALRQMYDCNSNYGESCYRLLTRNGNFIYLQTRGFLEIDKATNKVHSFVCINTLLDEEEGKRRVQEMKNKFSVIIQTKIPSNSPEDVPASQNPQQLERIVLYLIENLQKNDFTATNAIKTSHNASSTTMSDLNHQDEIMPTKVGGPHTVVLNAQPLALVPPEPSSVRNSISRSVSVVQQQYNAKSPSCSSQFCGSEVSLSPASSSNENNDDILLSSTEPGTHRASVLQMKPQTQLPQQADGNFSQHHNKINNVNINNHHKLSSPASSTSPIIQCMTPESSVSPDINHQCGDSNSSQYLCKEQLLFERLQTSTKKCPGKSNILRRINEVHTHNSPATSPKPMVSMSLSTPTTTRMGTTDLARGSVIPTEIHNVLTNSWRRLDQSLDSIGEDAHTLRQQQASHSIDRQLDALLVEHDMQQEMLVHIKSEYDAHLHFQQQEQQQLEQSYCINGASSLAKKPLSMIQIKKPL